MELERRKQIHSKLEITPLVDVVFLLLIFFMLTSSFIRPQSISVDLPQAVSSLPQTKTVIQVTLQKDGSVQVDGVEIERQLLTDYLKRLINGNLSQHSITVGSDQGAEVGKFIEVIDSIRLAGIDALEIATKRKGP